MPLGGSFPNVAIVRNHSQGQPARGRPQPDTEPIQELNRVLNLPLLVLYGLGVTIGAGIYVLVGVVVARAGLHAPLAFLLAALVMAPSACSFAEFTGRLPVSAGEAAYVREGFGSSFGSLIVGLMVVCAGSLTASAVSVGSAGYIREFIDFPETSIIAVVVLAMGLVAAWGILQSVTFAAIFTLIEIGGLALIVGAAILYHPEFVLRMPAILPASLDFEIWAGIAAAGLLAFFAFVGFEDMVNVAEEVKDPKSTMPAAIFITLIVATVIYFLVAAVAVLLVPMGELRTSQAPLAVVFTQVTGLSSASISAIAIVATLNGVIVQIIMASRVIYGLARQGNLPAVLARVNPVTRTPLVATTLVVAVILLLSLRFQVAGLAEMSARFTLSVFGLVCLALFVVKMRGTAAPDGVFIVPSWVPLVGFVSCLALLASDFLS